MTRRPNHDIKGRAYSGSLKDRVERATAMIADMTADRRPPRISIPAGNSLHADPCWDEDLYLIDLLEDLLSEVERRVDGRDFLSQALNEGDGVYRP